MSATILLADSDTTSLELMAAVLTRDGFRVLATPDGGDALSRFLEYSPDVVVCAAALPGMGGVQLCQHIKAQNPGTRVVLLGSLEHQSTNEVGPDAILPQPFRVSLLKPYLQAWGLIESTAEPAAPLCFGVPEPDFSALELLAPQAPQDPENTHPNDSAAALLTPLAVPMPLDLPPAMAATSWGEDVEFDLPPEIGPDSEDEASAQHDATIAPEMDLELPDEPAAAPEAELALDALMADDDAQGHDEDESEDSDAEAANLPFEESLETTPEKPAKELESELNLDSFLVADEPGEAGPGAPLEDAPAAMHRTAVMPQANTQPAKQPVPVSLPPSLPRYGDLAAMPLPRLLFELYVVTFSGRLVLIRQKMQRTIYFWGGFPVKVDSNQLSENLGRLLLDHGRITQEQYEQAQHLVESEELEQGEALLQIEALRSSELLGALSEQTEQKLVNSIAWRDGAYRIELDPSFGERAVMTEVHPLKAIWRGVREHYDLHSLLGFFAGLRERFVVATPLFTVHFDTLGPFLRDLDVASLLDGQTTFEQALRSDDNRAMEISQLLYVLLVTDMIRPASSPEATKAVVLAPSGAQSTGPKAANLVDYREITRICDQLAAAYLAAKDLHFFAFLGISIDASRESIEQAIAQRAAELNLENLPGGLPQDIVRRARELHDKLLKAKDTLLEPESLKSYRAGLQADPQESPQHSDAQGSAAPAPASKQQHIAAEKLFQAGQQALAQGDSSTAKERFKAAIVQCPGEPAFRVALGQAFAALPSPSAEDLRKSAVCFQQALQLDPSHIEANLRFAEALIAMGALPTARPYLLRILQKSPEHQSARKLLQTLDASRGA